MNKFAQEFTEAMLAAGINAPKEIVADGEMQRFPTPQDKGAETAGYYVMHINGEIAFGSFGDWRKDLGNPKHWKSNGGIKFTPEQQRAYDAIIENIKKQHRE